MSVADKPIALYVHWPCACASALIATSIRTQSERALTRRAIFKRFCKMWMQLWSSPVADRFQVSFSEADAEFDVGAGV